MDWKIPEIKFPFVLPEEYVLHIGDIPLSRPIQFLLLCCVFFFILRFLLKHIFTKAEHLRRALSVSMNILLIYCIFMVCYVFNPLHIQNYLGRLHLPFIKFEEDKLLFLFSIHNTFPELCTQILGMVFLAFLVSQVFDFVPGNLTPLGMRTQRFIATLFSIVVYYGACWALEKVTSRIPEEYLPFIPIGVLGALIVLFILGWLKGLMVKMLVLVNPTFDGLSGFFFKNRFGKHITRAMYATFLLTALAIGLEWALIREFSMTPAGLWDGIFAFLAVLFLWTFVGPMN